jgi:hypothetical protein
VAEEFVREGLAAIVERSDVTEISWAADTLVRCADIPKKSSRSSLGTLRSRIEAKRKEQLPDDLHAALEKLAISVGVNKPGSGGKPD